MNHHVHLGVTGLRRTGKTVFLTSLIYHLTELGSEKLRHFASQGVTLRAARLEHPRNTDAALFPYLTYLSRLRQDPPKFPVPTDREYGCLLRIGYQNANANGRLESVRRRFGLGRKHGTIWLHLHDYPGEYLLDVGLLRMTYQQWSATVLDRMHQQCPTEADRYQKAAENLKCRTSADVLQGLRRAYARYVLIARDAGLELVQPAMTLLKWYNRREAGGADCEVPTAEELLFVPLPQEAAEPSVWQEMCASYDHHVRYRVRPFVRRIRRCRVQLVLVDVLRVLRNGVVAYNNARACLAEVLRAYHDAWRPFGGVHRVLFAATKADHATKNYRANMKRLLDQLVSKAKGEVRAGLKLDSSEQFTSYRVTRDKTAIAMKREIDVLYGLKKGDAEAGSHNPGVVPQQWPEDDPDWVLHNERFAFPEFNPRPLPRMDGADWPHLDLDRVIWKVLQDCF